MSDFTLYILLRNDMPSMNSGKGAAQASHAANAFIHENCCTKKVKAKWQKATKQGFGTVIVLAAKIGEIEKVYDSIPDREDVGCNFVVDPTYPRVVDREIAALIDETDDSAPRSEAGGGKVVIYREETTCLYVFGEKEDCKPFIGHLPLHP